MRWPSAQAIAALSPLPAGYRYAQFGRADIAPLMSSVKEWHPGIAVGVNSCYLREDCRRRFKSEPPRRSNFEPGVEADFEIVSCG